MTKILGPVLAGAVLTCLGLPAMAEPLPDALHPADPAAIETQDTGSDPFTFAVPLSGPRTPSPSFGVGSATSPAMEGGQ